MSTSENALQQEKQPIIPVNYNSTPLLKKVGCIYVPVSNAYASAQWFNKHFDVKVIREVQPEDDGAMLDLANGMTLFLLKTTNHSTMNFRTDAWSGRNFVMNMIMFEVDHIESLRRKLIENGVKVDPFHDNGSCGIDFYFYDLDGNKFAAWEDQLVVRVGDITSQDDLIKTLKSKFRLPNEYDGTWQSFDSKLDVMKLKNRIIIDGWDLMLERFPDTLALEAILQRHTASVPERPWVIQLRPAMKQLRLAKVESIDGLHAELKASLGLHDYNSSDWESLADALALSTESNKYIGLYDYHLFNSRFPDESEKLISTFELHNLLHANRPWVIQYR